MFAVYTSPHVRGLIDRELNIRKTSSPIGDRCRAVGIPDGVKFTTMPELARGMIARALAAKLPQRGATVIGNGREVVDLYGIAELNVPWHTPRR